MAPSIFLLCFYLMLWTASHCFIQSRSAADFLVNIQLFFLYVIAAKPQFFMDKSIINRDEPCLSNVIVLDNHEVLPWILFFCKLKNKCYISKKDLIFDKRILSILQLNNGNCVSH